MKLESFTSSSSGQNRLLSMKYLSALSVLLTSCSMMPQASEPIFEAAYVWGAEVKTLRVCGGNAVYWTDATTWVLGPVVEYYKTHTTEPYTEIYLRFRGHFHDEVVDGFARQYDGLLHVSEVLEMKAVVPENCRQNK